MFYFSGYKHASWLSWGQEASETSEVRSLYKALSIISKAKYVQKFNVLDHLLKPFQATLLQWVMFHRLGALESFPSSHLMMGWD